MKKEQILRTIRALAQSQGFYGRVLAAIESEPKLLEDLESQNFKDEIDMILYFEC